MTDVFVFESNLGGFHNERPARFAFLHRGAIWGQGIGLQGQSYAIPTRDEWRKPLPHDRIAHYVQNFLEFAPDRPKMTFHVTPIGYGLSRFRRREIRHLFKNMPPNCRTMEIWEIPDR